MSILQRSPIWISLRISLRVSLRASLLGILAAAAVATPQFEDILVPRGADWRYLDNGVGQGSTWTDNAFDDSAWPQAPAEFGYGDGDEATLLSVGSPAIPMYPTYYFRREFQVADPTDFEAVEFLLKRDDGAVLYLNGNEIFRTGMPTGTIRYRTPSYGSAEGGAEEVYFPFYEQPTVLRAGTNVVAVELHLGATNHNDCSFDLEIIGHRGPSVIRDPYVQMVSESAATIRFRTASPTVGVVRYGTAPGSLVNTLTSPTTGIDHELRLTGLAPGTRTYYSVGTPQAALVGDDQDHWFQTAPPTGSRTPFRTWLLGDAGTYNSKQRAVRDAYAAMSNGRHTDLMLFLGDNAYRIGTDQEYQLGVFEIYDEQLRQTPSWSTRGNHELIAPAYFGAFTLPDAAQCGGIPSGAEDYYSFDWGNVHFVCLDSWASDKSIGGPMYQWCDADLASTTQDWIVAYFHHPPYSKGSHDSDVEIPQLEMREHFVPLLEDHGVSLVFSGHSHGYERTFLIDNHIRHSRTFNVGIHAVDAGLGREVQGTGAYERSPGPHGGAVYVVAGSAGQVSTNGTLDHPAMAWSERSLGSVVLDVIGGRMDVTFLDDAGVAKDYFTLLDPAWDGGFCIGSVNGEGCVATMSTSGTPSVASGQPFVVTTNQIRTGATSMLLYGLAPSSTPFSGGQLCIAPPLMRTIPADAGGTAACTGSHSVDFAPLWGTTGLNVGAHVYCQTWYRDTTLPSMRSISEAITFTILP